MTTDDAESAQYVELCEGSIYEITTEHGTRIVVDLSAHPDYQGFAYHRWIRLPADHEDGQANTSSTDGTWQRLFAARPHEHHVYAEPGLYIMIGDRFVFFDSLNSYWLTTVVVAVRELDELPPKLAAAPGYQDAEHVAAQCADYSDWV